MVGFKVKIISPEGVEHASVAKSHLLVGRGAHCDIHAGEKLANEHLRIWFDGGHLWSQDLGSKEGTTINGTPLQPLRPFLFKETDVFKFGETGLSMTFQMEANTSQAIGPQDTQSENNAREVLIQQLGRENEQVMRENEKLRSQIAKITATPEEEEEVSQVKLNALTEVKAMKTAEAKRFERWKRDSVGELEKKVLTLLQQRPGVKISKDEAAQDLSAALRTILLGDRVQAPRRMTSWDTTTKLAVIVGLALVVCSTYLILSHRPARRPASVVYVAPQPSPMYKQKAAKPSATERAHSRE